ncbi:unnamed protein product [Cladocopium goreaui]|uniref:Poly [ADP-ribose] polymerase (PARP) n=1 Tax=Cladocopium goreaui TaxID=2562237 RepID=A0A9P1G4P5_9DINO|nr:unnamed protein product [Cladocopium goreaui]
MVYKIHDFIHIFPERYGPSKELKSPQLEKRLETGSVVDELRLAGERLHYRLLRGAGPPEGASPSGWVSYPSRSRLGDTSIFSSAQAACSSLLYETCSSVLGMAASGGDEGGPVTSVTSERPCERGCGRASFRHYNTCVLIKDGAARTAAEQRAVIPETATPGVQDCSHPPKRQDLMKTLQDGCDRFLFPRECAKGAAAERASVTLRLAARVTWMEIWVGDLLGWRELQGVINSDIEHNEGLMPPWYWRVMSRESKATPFHEEVEGHYVQSLGTKLIQQTLETRRVVKCLRVEDSVLWDAYSKNRAEIRRAQENRTWMSFSHWLAKKERLRVSFTRYPPGKLT